MLTRIKTSLPEIKHALLTVDDEALSIDNLKAIARAVPSSEEVLFFTRPPNLALIVRVAFPYQGVRQLDSIIEGRSVLR